MDDVLIECSPGISGDMLLGAFYDLGVPQKVIEQPLIELGLSCPKPEVERWEKGKWDDQDFVINDAEISIKSMAFFSNLLLLETKDWDLQGNYIPNKKKYDLFVIVRIKPDLKSFFRSKRKLYSNFLNEEEVREMITAIEFEADIPGFEEGEDYALFHYNEGLRYAENP